MPIKNIIFDWDGTLARSLELWLEGYQKSFKARDHDFSDAFIAAEFFHNHHLVPEKHPDLEFEAIADETRSHVMDAISGIALFEGAIDTIEAAKSSGVQTTLVSSSSRKTLLSGLNSHDLEKQFISIVAGDDGFGHKPDHLPFQETLNRVGGNASETMIIGDSKVDIQAGKALGCTTCFFAHERNEMFHDFEAIRSHAPDIEINDLSMLLDHI